MRVLTTGRSKLMYFTKSIKEIVGNNSSRFTTFYKSHNISI